MVSRDCSCDYPNHNMYRLCEIIRIEILEHKDAYLPQAEMTADRVLTQQSLEVDAVSGATLTTDTVLKAIEDALRQGVYGTS